jgi:amino acid adenylation domain-containing protein
MLGRLHSGFAMSVLARRDRPALSLDGTTWSYGQLDELARGWASALLAVAAEPSRIGLLAARSLASYAGMIAVLYTGATVVPLNPKFPNPRTRAMIELADVDAILVDASCAGLIPGLLAGLPGIPAVIASEAAAGARPREPVWPDEDHAAYLLFTSGSTGQPKGVAITHRNVSHFLRVNAERYQFSEHDRFSQTFDQTFDLAMFDLFMAWSSGGCLVPLDQARLLSPVRFVHEESITVWFSVPAVVAMLRHRDRLPAGSLDSLQWSLFCGESLPVASAQAWQRAAPRSILENLYGPTEATISCTAHRWDAKTSPDLAVNGIVPIGSPYPGMKARLLGDDGQAAATGRTGELCVAGPQVFAGYWRDPPRSADRLFTESDGSGALDTWYRTGDEAKRLDNGEYAFIGRSDSQVKVRGHRVDLAEVQAILETRQGVVQAVAFTVPGRVKDTNDLVAVVTGTGLDATALLNSVRRNLPIAMVPRELHVLRELPLTSNGKVDREALRSRFGLRVN